MAHAIWVWFVVLYALGVAGSLSAVVRVRRHRREFERQIGPLPPPGAIVAWLVPPIILLTHLGEIAGGWPWVRTIGVALSLYSLVMLPWTIGTLGRFAIPGLALYPDHQLVTSGPFRIVRHPLYSSVTTLWLAAALGTMNWLLLVLWPVNLMMLARQMRTEEAMLRQKFGADYDQYAARTSRVIPWIGARGGVAT